MTTPVSSLSCYMQCSLNRIIFKHKLYELSGQMQGFPARIGPELMNNLKQFLVRRRETKTAATTINSREELLTTLPRIYACIDPYIIITFTNACRIRTCRNRPLPTLTVKFHNYEYVVLLFCSPLGQRCTKNTGYVPYILKTLMYNPQP